LNDPYIGKSINAETIKGTGTGNKSSCNFLFRNINKIN